MNFYDIGNYESLDIVIAKVIKKLFLQRVGLSL